MKKIGCYLCDVCNKVLGNQGSLIIENGEGLVDNHYCSESCYNLTSIGYLELKLDIAIAELEEIERYSYGKEKFTKVNCMAREALARIKE